MWFISRRVWISHTQRPVLIRCIWANALNSFVHFPFMRPYDVRTRDRTVDSAQLSLGKKQRGPTFIPCPLYGVGHSILLINSIPGWHGADMGCAGALMPSTEHYTEGKALTSCSGKPQEEPRAGLARKRGKPVFYTQRGSDVRKNQFPCQA